MEERFKLLSGHRLQMVILYFYQIVHQMYIQNKAQIL